MSALGARARAIYGGWAGRVEDRTTAGRQRELDALRLVGVLGVVLGHWLVTAVVRSPDGSLRVQSPLASMPSLTPVSWALQTLAVFFLVGGFAAARSRRRASGYGSWLRGRLVRLWRPAAGLLGAWALATVCLAAAGVPPRTLRTLLTLVVSPLWFLVVFSAVSAATPLLMAAARRTGLLLVVGAVLLVAAVDVARFALGAPHWTGYLNLAAGWSVPFGLGVLWESGRLRGRVLPLALLLGGAAATALLILLAGYPASMVGVPGAPVSNLNPPTLAAVCFGAAQCGAAMLLAPRLAGAMRRPAWWAPVAAVNLVALPVFLWHQTAMLLVTSTGLRFGGLPGLGTPPESGTWVLAPAGLAAGVPRHADRAPHRPGEDRSAASAHPCGGGPDPSAEGGRRGRAARRLALVPPDDVPAAQRARRVAVEVGGALRRGVADLTGDPGRPLPPLANPRWRALRWTPHAVVVLVAVVTTASAGPVLHSGYGVPVALTTALVLAQGFALVLALYRPLQGWWLSIVVILLLAVATAPPAATQLYPLPAPALIGELVLLAVVAAQLPARVTSAVWVVTLAAQAVPALVLGGNADGVTAFALLSVLALLATSALRSRGEVGRRLAEQEQRTEVERARRAVLEERARIARELHDVVAHHMSVVAIQAEAAPYRVSEVPPELLTTLTTIRGSALEALAELRRVLGVLRADGAAGDPPEEPARDPAPSLAELDPLLARVRGLGHPVSMSVVGEPRALPAGVELSAYRIVQESLSNVVRHAPRAPVELELSYADDGLGLVVRNAPCPGEGRSAGPAPVALAQGTGAGHGLLGMRERAAALGGEVVAGPLAGGGFEVRAVLPSEVPVAGRGADAG